MSEKKWTPGPWQYDELDFNRDDELCCGAVGALSGMQFIVAEVEFLGEDDSFEPIANGHLIAAAPELYESLEALRKWAFDFAAENDGHVPTDLAADVEYALAKARGEQE